MTQKIAYEPHPVTPERKAELVSQGFKILDVRFKPDGGGEDSGIPSRSDIAKMSKPECIEWLEAHGAVEPNGTVKDLRDQLRGVIYLEA